MRQLLNRVALLAEKELLKELKQMAERLKGLDKSPDVKLSSDEVQLILGNYFWFSGFNTSFTLSFFFISF